LPERRLEAEIAATTSLGSSSAGWTASEGIFLMAIDELCSFEPQICMAGFSLEFDADSC
jgi:hypothetical protein